MQPPAAATTPVRSGIDPRGAWRLPPGTHSVGPYRLGRLLARRVYLARAHDGARVALKVLPALADGAGYGRLAAEYQLLSAVQDARVVRARAHGVHDGVAYLALDYVGGATLRERIRGGLAGSTAVRTLSEAARALSAVHAAGIVHRDVKPENLLRAADGALVLADFGVAARIGDVAACARPGCLVGSIAYAAPEQLGGAAPAPAADVYSLGVLFYELLCGRLPFAARTPLELLSQHLVAAVPKLPPRMASWQGLIDRLLDKHPEHRPPHAGAVLQEFLLRAPDGAAAD